MSTITAPSLNDLMAIDHVIRVHGYGRIADAVNVYAPEVYADTAEDGQISNDDESRMIETARKAGWTLLTGWTHQYSYNGAIMHPSEYIGGGLEEHIRNTPGLWVAVAVETLDDSEEAAGWALAFREAEHPEEETASEVGRSHGDDHARYVEAYGGNLDATPDVPARFSHVASAYLAAYAEGAQDYADNA